MRFYYLARGSSRPSQRLQIDPPWDTMLAHQHPRHQEVVLANKLRMARRQPSPPVSTRSHRPPLNPQFEARASRSGETARSAANGTSTTTERRRRAPANASTAGARPATSQNGPQLTPTTIPDEELNTGLYPNGQQARKSHGRSGQGKHRQNGPTQGSNLEPNSQASTKHHSEQHRYESSTRIVRRSEIMKGSSRNVSMASCAAAYCVRSVSLLIQAQSYTNSMNMQLPSAGYTARHSDGMHYPHSGYPAFAQLPFNGYWAFGPPGLPQWRGDQRIPGFPTQANTPSPAPPGASATSARRAGTSKVKPSSYSSTTARRL